MTTSFLNLSRMLQFGDSVLPIGAFAFSGGLESAVQKGIVHNEETLREYADTALEIASKGDAIAVNMAAEAALKGDLDTLCRIDEEVLCRKLSEETRLMTLRMGKKLTELGVQLTGNDLMAQWSERIAEERTPGTFPVSLALTGVVVQATKPGETQAVDVIHLYGGVMTILNAAIRLMRITHIDTQRVLYQLTPTFEERCVQAAQSSLEQMSNFAPMTDILAALHVRAHVRLFMS